MTKDYGRHTRYGLTYVVEGKCLVRPSKQLRPLMAKPLNSATLVLPVPVFSWRYSKESEVFAAF